MPDSTQSAKNREEARQIIIKLRWKKGLSQTAIASAIGYNSSYLSQALNGKKPFNETMIQKLRDYFQEQEREQEPTTPEAFESLSESIAVKELLTEVNDLQKEYKAQKNKGNGSQDILRKLYEMINERMKELVNELDQKNQILEDLRRDKDTLTKDKQELYKIIQDLMKVPPH